MKRVYLIVAFALFGLGCAGWLLYEDSAPVHGTGQPLPRWQPPFSSFVAGSGIVEAASTNVPIGSSVGGIITKVYVKPGSLVEAGEPLFQIDDRSLRAHLAPLASKLLVAKEEMEQTCHLFEMDRKLYERAPALISKKRYIRAHYDCLIAKAHFQEVKSQLQVLKEKLSLYTVRSPLQGKVLRCAIHAGSYFPPSGGTPPLIVVGSRDLRVRVEIDEYEAWRFDARAKAVAFVRGDPQMKLTLHYLYTEPMIVPKTLFKGVPTERTDTRVLQVVYRFDRPKFPLYVGETLDVFIEAPKSE